MCRRKLRNMRAIKSPQVRRVADVVEDHSAGTASDEQECGPHQSHADGSILSTIVMLCCPPWRAMRESPKAGLLKNAGSDQENKLIDRPADKVDFAQQQHAPMPLTSSSGTQSDTLANDEGREECFRSCPRNKVTVGKEQCSHPVDPTVTREPIVETASSPSRDHASEDPDVWLPRVYPTSSSEESMICKDRLNVARSVQPESEPCGPRFTSSFDRNFTDPILVNKVVAVLRQGYEQQQVQTRTVPLTLQRHSSLREHVAERPAPSRRSSTPELPSPLVVAERSPQVRRKLPKTPVEACSSNTGARKAVEECFPGQNNPPSICKESSTR